MSINADRVIAVRTGKTVYRDGDTVLKVFDSDYSKADILNEALNQARIEETGLSVPRIIEVTRMDDRWAIRWEYAQGKTLQQLLDEHPDRHSEYLKLLVEIQADVFSRRSPLLNRLRDKLDVMIGKSDLDAVTRYELHTRLDDMPQGKSVCHGDFNPSNVVIKTDGTATVIDWAHATQGDPAADGARSYLLFLQRGDREYAEEYLELFCVRTGMPKAHVQKWMPIVAAALSVKGTPAQRKFLLQWYSSTEK
ncbi:MAG TPA: aminoglycoside phosphotransferase family protein [Eubacteriales bacterium]|nr:aminoglycoside phosphotransferase family protein [Eubacteriales bacterium]